VQLRFFVSLFACLVLVSRAHAVALNAGDLVVADPNGVRISKVDPVSGAVTDIITGSFWYGVTFAPDGRLFASAYYDQAVQLVNPVSGTAITVSSGGLLAGTICVTWGPDGMLYTGSNAPRIVKVDPATGLQTLVCSGGLLNNPQELAFTPSGDLLVANYDNRVIKVNTVSGAQSVYATGGMLGVTSGVAVAGDGTVYATDILNSLLIRIAPVTLTQSLVTSSGPIATPRGITLDPFGRILVCSQNNGQLARVGLPAGPAAGLSPSFSFSLPYGVAVVPEGVVPTRADTWGRVKALYR
jgi:streptogramin lyase